MSLKDIYSVVIITQGGAVAAPVAGQILSEVLPYMEIKKVEGEEVEKVEVPNVIGMTVKEAKKVLSEIGLELKINNEQEITNNGSRIIKEQTPKEGIKMEKNTYILCDIE